VEILVPAIIIVIGLGLIAVEVYLIPGMNLAGIAGFLAVMFGIGYMFAESGMTGGIVSLLLTGFVAGGMFYMMWQSGAWDRFVLATNLKEDEETATRESENRSKYLGRVGRAVTPLRPTGVVEIEGERIEVITEGDFIASGSDVRIVAMDRRRYFVRLADALSERAH
jgi:membrane-bound ClpP family serine protease